MKKRDSIKTLMEDITRTSKILKRSNIFEDYGMPQGEEMPMNDEQGGMPQDEEMGMEDNQPSEQTVDTINQIRELAIQGIAQYANDVESEEYQALKKIWLLTDKFYEGMQEDDEKAKKI